MNLVGMRSRHHHVAVQADFGAVLVHVGSQSSPSRVPPSRQGGDPQRHCPSLTPSSPPLPPLLRHRVHSHTHPTAAAAAGARVAECRKGLERESESGLRARLSCPLPPSSLHLLSVGRSVGRTDGRPGCLWQGHARSAAKAAARRRRRAAARRPPRPYVCQHMRGGARWRGRALLDLPDIGVPSDTQGRTRLRDIGCSIDHG